ncbi:Mobile element protein [hydrothermal vent metagenome]|uniref:Mobile element protein n=1 Tax=hydrothermal vent metagenome TaxID=652676 RepID=A0A3B1DPH4_9ZZZZ
MTSPHSGNPVFVQKEIPFEQRAPSTVWELLPATSSLPSSVWVWFKPTFAPQSLVFQIPDETWQQIPPVQLTLRQLLQAAEVPVEKVLKWHLHGNIYEGMDGTNPLFDQIILPAEGGIVPAINVSLQVSVPQSIAPSSLSPAVVIEKGVSEWMEEIEEDWNESLKLEAKLVLLRKQVVGLLSRLNSLNRELTTEEQLCGDRQDLTEWQDARRWLRDSIGRLSRLMKELDIGITSPAGKRSGFEQIYEQHILPRQPFEGLEQSQRDFKTHHKALQTLLSRLTVANNNANTDGVNRAQRILSKISAKARQARSKRK